MQAFVLAAALLFSQLISGTGHRAVFTPVVSCSSGACSDSFVGTASTLLATHDTNWETLSSALPVSALMLTGTGSVKCCSDGNSSHLGGAVYTPSTSDTSKVSNTTSPPGGGALLGTCVRCGSGNGAGYHAVVIAGTGTNGTAIIKKEGSADLATVSNGTWTSGPHTIAIVASGTSTVSLSLYVDGTVVLTATDTTSTYSGGHPGIYIVGGGTDAQNQIGPWTDH